MFQIAAKDIGGGIVRRTFSSGGKRLYAGMKLTGEQVRLFNPANRMALIEKRFIDVYPVGTDSALTGERFVISAGFGAFNVIEGRKLNDEPLNREQAYALAGIPEPPRRKRSNGNGDSEN
jgi:hypothetical protein